MFSSVGCQCGVAVGHFQPDREEPRLEGIAVENRDLCASGQYRRRRTPVEIARREHEMRAYSHTWRFSRRLAGDGRNRTESQHRSDDGIPHVHDVLLST